MKLNDIWRTCITSVTIQVSGVSRVNPQSYVALSRVRSLEGLRIEKLDCSILTGKKPCNILALDEMNTLKLWSPIKYWIKTAIKYFSTAVLQNFFEWQITNYPQN